MLKKTNFTINEWHFKGSSNIAKIFQWYNYFNIFCLPPAGVLAVIFTLNLNDLESAKLSFGSSLYYRHKLPDVFE